MYASITSTGIYLPENIVTNDFFEKILDTSSAWIKSRTGIKERRFAQDGITSSFMAAEAIKDLMIRANLKAEDIDLIIVSTITPDMMFPSTACLVQKKIGARNAWGFDLSSACSGFIFALQTGASFIETKKYNKVIVVGVDTMSSILNFKDRNTCILFGDGAGAVLLEPSKKYGLIDSILHIDGRGGEDLHMLGGGSLNKTSKFTLENNMHYVSQNGKVVFKNAIRGMTNTTRKLMERYSLNKKQIDLLIAHQANKRIIDSVAKNLDFEENQVFINIEKYANTTAATIPIAIHEAALNKRLQKNSNLILTAFGAGYSWGSSYIKWGEIYE